MEQDQPSTEALRAHRRVLFPLIGTLLTAMQLRSATSDADQIVLRAAARWQGIGSGIVLMHAVLQIGVELVRWMFAVGPGLGQPLDALVPWVLLACTVLNLLSGAVEYGFVIFWGLRAAAGREVPFLAKSGEPHP